MKNEAYAFLGLTGQEICCLHIPWEGDLPKVNLVTRRAVTAAEEEKSCNPRSRSAKLRAAERTR